MFLRAIKLKYKAYNLKYEKKNVLDLSFNPVLLVWQQCCILKGASTATVNEALFGKC